MHIFTFVMIKQTSGIKIAFLVNDLHFNTLRPIYLRLKADPAFNVIVIPVRKEPYSWSPEIGAVQISSLLEQAGIEVSEIQTLSGLEEFAPQFVFYSNPYDMYYPQEFQSQHVSAFSKILHLSYGVPLVKWKGPFLILGQNPFLKHAFAIFVESRFVFPFQKKFVPVGYLKVSGLELGESVHLRNTLPVVAWKPRWDLENLQAFYSQLQFFERFVESSLHKLRIIEHDFFRSNLSFTNSGIIWETYEVFRNHPNVEVVSGANFLQRVLTSDVLVSEVSSTLAEFLSTGKPIIFVMDWNGKRSTYSLNLIGKFILRSAFKARSVSEMETSLKKALYFDKEKKIARRKRLFKFLFYVSPRQMSPTEKVIDFLLRNSLDSKS